MVGFLEHKNCRDLIYKIMRGPFLSEGHRRYICERWNKGYTGNPWRLCEGKIDIYIDEADAKNWSLLSPDLKIKKEVKF